MNGHGEIRKKSFCIGALTIEPSRNILVKADKTYPLEPRVMDVLCALATKPREVISRDTIIETIWNVEFGADESLTRAISLLRKTFKAAGETKNFIQTIPKRGYRLAVDVTEARPKPTTPLSPQTTFTNNAPTPKLSQPLKMVAADISGFKPSMLEEKTTNARLPQSAEINRAPLLETLEEPPELITKKYHSKKIYLGLALLLAVIIALILSGFNFSNKKQGKFGNSLGVAEYGRSIAVLSLVDMSPMSNLEYFADGTAEEILNTLTQVPDLRVTGRASSFAYKDKTANIRKIGTELKVSHIIDGSVRKHNDRVKVTIRLNNVSDGTQVWSKTYTGSLENTFSLQEEISRDLIINLELLLGINLDQVIKVDQLDFD